MTTYIRPAAVARDDADMIAGWNISPNTGYQLQISATPSGVVVILLSANGSTLLGSGTASIGAAQPVTITPMSGQTVDMADAALGWHLLLTTNGTEGDRTITMDAMVDLSARTHPVYADDDLALAVGTADINAGTHYTQDVVASCPLGFGAGVGDTASVPVDGSAVVGQVESITWSGTPDGSTAQAVIRRHVAVAPEPYVAPVPPVPPTVADDAGTTDAATATSGNVLENDDNGLTVVAVNGLAGNVGVAVEGTNGGSFTIAADGGWTFDPDGDFALLTGSETAATSVPYHASNGQAEASATLTVTVSAGDGDGDQYFGNVVFLLQVDPSAIDGTTDYADAKNNALYKCSNPLVSTVNSEKVISFSGSNFITLRAGDVHCSPVADTNKNGSLDMTFEFVANVTANILHLYKLGATGSGTGTTIQHRGGFTIYVSSNEGVAVFGGNLSRDTAYNYYGKRTGPVAAGRREIVVRIVSNEVHVYVDGVEETLTTYSTTYNKADNLSNSQLYVPRSVNIASWHKYDCLNDSTMSSSFGICSATNITAMRITRGVARDVQYPLVLPFPTI